MMPMAMPRQGATAASRNICRTPRFQNANAIIGTPITPDVHATYTSASPPTRAPSASTSEYDEMQSPISNAHNVAFNGAFGLAPTANTPSETSTMPTIFSGAGTSCAVIAAPTATSKGAEPRDSV